MQQYIKIKIKRLEKIFETKTLKKNKKELQQMINKTPQTGGGIW